VAKNEEGKVGGLFNIKSVEKIKVQRIAVEKNRLKSHCFWDGRDSWLKLLSHSIGLSSTWDMKLIERCSNSIKQVPME
jgi:beta-glucosidase